MTIGGHQAAASLSTVWLTPPHILAALGPFDLDPCAAPEPRPWPTAAEMFGEADGDGLALDWSRRRVWLNAPYDAQLEAWIRKLADSGRGTALIFARTETKLFDRQVWCRASGLLFLFGRLHFHYSDGSARSVCPDDAHEWAPRLDSPKAFWCPVCGKAKANAGAPSVLCAYGAEDMDRLAASELPGSFVPLRFARFALVAGLDLSWSQAMRAWLELQSGPVSVSDAYRFFARHPKASRNRHWRAKVRQKLMQVGDRVGPNLYAGARL